MNIYKVIEEIIAKYTDKNGHIGFSRYEDERGDSFSLEEELNEIFDQLFDESDIRAFHIDSMTTFDSPGYDTGVISIAWIDTDDCLNHELIQWESY